MYIIIFFYYFLNFPITNFRTIPKVAKPTSCFNRIVITNYNICQTAMSINHCNYFIPEFIVLLY